MKNKLYLTITTLALTTALLLSVAAQNGNLDSKPRAEAKPAVKPQGSLLGKQIKLPCEGISGGDVASTVRVTNNTGSSIPSQTMIYLQTSNGAAKEALSTELATRREANLHAPKGNRPASCQAWFFKK